jgi:hypothetical protein
MDEVETEVLAHARELMDWVDGDADLELITPDAVGRYAGIVTFCHRGLDQAGHAALYRALMKDGIVCAHRAGGIRFAAHFYSDLSGLDARWQSVIATVC